MILWFLLFTELILLVVGGNVALIAVFLYILFSFLFFIISIIILIGVINFDKLDIETKLNISYVKYRIDKEFILAVIFWDFLLAILFLSFGYLFLVLFISLVLNFLTILIFIGIEGLE